MLKIENIKLPPGTSQAALAAEAARILKVREKDLRHLQVLRRSVDAREGVFMVYTVEVSLPDEAAVLRHTRNRKVSLCPPRPDYHPPAPQKAPQLPPVVVGAGPAGSLPRWCWLLRAAAHSAGAGTRCGAAAGGRGAVLVLRSAGPQQQCPIRRRGCGAFSDGKLNTGTRDIRHRFILEQLVSCGAPEEILIDAKPHVGTDFLTWSFRTCGRSFWNWERISGLKAGWSTWISGMAAWLASVWRALAVPISCPAAI